MKSFIIVALFIAAAVAAPAGPDADAVVVEQNLDNIGVEGYNYGYKTSNGISQSETGKLVDQGTENEGIEASGQYSFVGLDGVVYAVTYTAGRNGFQPSGAHLPQ